MSPKYGLGWVRGVAETETAFRKQYHLNGITYRELCGLFTEHGRVTLRNNRYPMMMMVVSLVKPEEFFYIHAIAEKFMWVRFEAWRKGTAIRLIWEGFTAQNLIRKLLPYMSQGTMRQKALKALQWTPKGGVSAVEDNSDLANISAW